MNDEAILDPERQQKAQQYARIKRRLMLLGLVLDALYAMLWLLCGWASGLKEQLLAFTTNDWLLVAAFVIIFGVIDGLVGLPLSYYSGFVLPHRYDLSNQSLKEWIIDLIKGMLVAAPIGLIVLELLYWFLRAHPENWWLWAAGFLLLFNVILGNLAPILILPIFNKYTPLEEEHAELVQRLMDLAKKADTKVNGVYQFDLSRQTKAANAALVGIGGNRRIILGDTLLQEFSSDEIETVLAHELGHQVNKDMFYSVAIGSLLTLGGLYLVSLILQYGVQLFGFSSTADIAALPLFGLALGVYGLITMPLSNGFSRWRERKADMFALKTTGKGQAYASALTRLANQNLAEVDPDPWIEWLLHSHPSLNKRIQMAQRFTQSDS